MHHLTHGTLLTCRYINKIHAHYHVMPILKISTVETGVVPLSGKSHVSSRPSTVVCEYRQVLFHGEVVHELVVDCA